MLAHQAESNAPLTSKLTITLHCFGLKISSIKFLISVAASNVPLCGVNPYWLSFNRSLECMWNSILSIINLSNSLHPIFSRLIGRYFDMSLHFSFPSLIIGIITECFQFLGQHPFFGHALYIYVKNKGKTRKALIGIR